MVNSLRASRAKYYLWRSKKNCVCFCWSCSGDWQPGTLSWVFLASVEISAVHSCFLQPASRAGTVRTVQNDVDNVKTTLPVTSSAERVTAVGRQGVSCHCAKQVNQPACWLNFYLILSGSEQVYILARLFCFHTDFKCWCNVFVFQFMKYSLMRIRGCSTISLLRCVDLVECECRVFVFYMQG